MLCSLFQWVVRQSAELENNFTSVERIVSYSKLAPEVGLVAVPLLCFCAHLSFVFCHSNAGLICRVCASSPIIALPPTGLRRV